MGRRAGINRPSVPINGVARAITADRCEPLLDSAAPPQAPGPTFRNNYAFKMADERQTNEGRGSEATGIQANPGGRKHKMQISKRQDGAAGRRNESRTDKLPSTAQSDGCNFC